MSKSEGNFLTLAEAVKKFSADGMRLCLADSGDSIEDANFVESIADAGILRLYTFIEWVNEMKASESSLRSGPTDSFYDRVFINEMNLKTVQTDNNYKSMLFKEALRTGFFELQAVRDKYRELTANENGMHHDLVFKFIELQALLLSPICPHVSEHVYEILGHTGSILRAKWPVPGPIDNEVIEASDYLMTAAHSFRLQKKNYLQVVSRKTKKPVNEVEKPNNAVIFIAKTFPPWQSVVLNTMLELSQKNNSTLPDNKVISVALNQKAELKRHMKKVMPFVQTVRQKVEQSGLSALNQTLAFNEYEVLTINLSYLKHTLELDEIAIKYTDSEGVPDNVKEECCPGDPHILFLASERRPVPLKLINVIPQNGLFTTTVNIADCPSVEKLIEKLRKELKLTKDKKIEIWRYKDPKWGTRKIPSPDEMFADKEKVDAADSFEIDDESTIHIRSNGHKVLIGDTAVYKIV